MKNFKYELTLPMIDPQSYFDEIESFNEKNSDPLYLVMHNSEVTWTNLTPGLNQPEVRFESNNLQLMNVVNKIFKAWNLKIQVNF